MIVLDTNVVSEAMKPEPNPVVLAWLNDQAAETLYITSVTLAELLFGIQALPQGKRRDLLDSALNDLLALFQDRVLPFDTDAARHYAGLAVSARMGARGFPTPGGYIAAIASSRGFVVASRDTAPFEAAGGGGCQSVELTLARMSPTLCERACTRWWPSVAWLTQVQAMQLRACGDLHASGRLEQFADVRLPVFLLKQDVFFLHLALGDAPKLAHFMRGRVRDDEGLEHNIRLPQPLLDVLDRFVEADLGILEADVADAFRVDEGHALPFAFELPDDEVRVEVSGLEEADATALAEVAQQVEFPFRKIAGVGVVERLQVLDEPALAFVERGG